MPTALTVGPVHTLVQNEVYALPGIAQLHIYSNVGLEMSNVSAFTTSDTVAANDTLPAGAAFVRSTTGAAIVRLTRT